MPPSRKGRRHVAFTAFLLVVSVVALALGIWQVQRRAWKHDLIARVEHRVHAAPVGAPGPSQWAEVSAARDEYRHVAAEGRFLHAREVLVQAVTEQGGGFWVLTPLVTARGFTVMVNRGFVPTERRDPASRAAGQMEGPVRVVGLMRMSEPGGAFLRSNDPAAGRWYSRDVDAMAQALGLGAVAPYFIDADATPNPGGYPRGGLTIVSFPDNHLVYALTWFALAAMAGAAAVWVWVRR